MSTMTLVSDEFGADVHFRQKKSAPLDLKTTKMSNLVLELKHFGIWLVFLALIMVSRYGLWYNV